MTKVHRTRAWATLLLSVLVFALAGCRIAGPTVRGDVYYAAPWGSDNGAGTRDDPFLTIDYAAEKLTPGDTLYLREGVYHQIVDICVQGTDSMAITISAEPGSKVVIDGDTDGDGTPDLPKRSGDEGWTDPRFGNTFYWSGLVQFVDWDGEPSTHVVFRGIEVRNSAGRGISMHPGGSSITIEDCHVHHTWHTPIHMQGVSKPTVRSTIVHDGSSFAPYSRNASEQNWPGNVQFTDVVDGLADRLTVYNNWGEGVLIGHSDGVVLRNSVIYDNFALNVYTSHASNFVIRNNLIYSTGTAPFLRGGEAPSNLIIADEWNPNQQNGSGQVVINNLIMGGSRNLGFWDFSWQGTEGSGLVDAVIAHNTILDAVSYGIEINQGAHSNARICNNVIANPNTGAVLAAVADDPELILSHNLWTSTPVERARGPNDVIAADLGLARGGSTEPGSLEAAYFDPTASFAGIDAGTQSPAVVIDYFRRFRDRKPDIGAVEYTRFPCRR